MSASVLGDGRFELVVAAKERVAEAVVRVVLTRPDGVALPTWTPGAHIDLILADQLVRQYSLCGDPADGERWEIGVLHEPDGRGGSRHVHQVLDVGDQVTASAPRNNFQLVPAPEYLFLAGGIGITPILPMVHAAQAAGATWRLVYGGRRHASMAFLDRLAQYGSRVTIHPEDIHGQLDLASLLDIPRPDVAVYCCGPEGLLAAVESRCSAWPAGSLHVERFQPRPVGADDIAGAGTAGTAGTGDVAVALSEFDVVLAQSGRTVRVPTSLSVLEALEAAGVDVLSSCREGVCGTCETGVVEGEPDHRDSILTEEERAASGLMMVCVSRSRTPKLVLDL
ncbi:MULTISPECIES: PDR/VanB family oxidoreductase [unclassified Frankia]|uniref:PDR/VanB family oxidoreductase n=1 Tax=unclassified Frankia TaxID=2632575 RepID=UPI001EF72ABC|nr:MULTISPECIES: PDR/VanB family oxidoreductase [unclassified Frankia]